MGKMPEYVLDRVKTRQFPRVLVVCGKLLEGFDHRPVSVVAIYRNVARATCVMFTQFVGRCVRRCSPRDPIMVISHVKFNQQENFNNMDAIAEEDPANPEEDQEEQN